MGIDNDTPTSHKCWNLCCIKNEEIIGDKPNAMRLKKAS